MNRQRVAVRVGVMVLLTGLTLAGCERDDGAAVPAATGAERDELLDEVFEGELRALSGGADCPEGFTLAGAAPPRGSGMWCQRVEGTTVTARRTDGTLWVEVVDSDPEGGPERGGRTTVYAADGRTVARVVERRNHETVHFEEPVPGVEVPPGVPRN